MNDRLTYSSSTKQEAWLACMFPLMLLLTAVAMIPLAQLPEMEPVNITLGDREILLPLKSLSFLLLVAQSGILLRSLLPHKSSLAMNAFAGICGMGIPFIFLVGFLDSIPDTLSSSTGSAFVLASWLFSIHAKKEPLLWIVASGLLAGLACSFSPVCVSGALALVFYSLFKKGVPFETKILGGGIWTAAFICGNIPALTGDNLRYLTVTKIVEPEFIKGGLEAIGQSTPVWAWVFAAIGLFVSIIQKQKILLGLVLPFFIFRLLLSGLLPIETRGANSSLPTMMLHSVDPTLLLPLSWLTAFGMIRVLKGVQQGVRKVNDTQAKKIAAIACVVFILGFLIKVADLFYYFS